MALILGMVWQDSDRVTIERKYLGSSEDFLHEQNFDLIIDPELVVNTLIIISG